MAHLFTAGRRFFSVVLAVTLGLFCLPVTPVFADEDVSPATDEAAAQSEEAATPSDTDTAAPADNSSSTAVPDSTEANNSAVSEQTDNATEAADEATEEDAEKDKKAREAEAAYEKAFETAGSAVGTLGDMPALTAALAPSFDQLDVAQASVDEAAGLREPLEEERVQVVEQRKALLKEREEIEAQRAEALYGLLLTDKELSQTGGIDLASVIVGVNNATLAEANEYLLEKIALTYAAAIDEADQELAAVDKRIEAADVRIGEIDDALLAAEKQLKEAKLALEDVVDQGNRAAFAIEKLASEARQRSKEAIETVEALDSKVDGVDDMKEAAKSWDVRSNGTRAQALALAGEWYDATDALVGLEGSITFGTGLDFALDEDDFVAKWGPAIDTFFVSQGAPLQGYGEEMARVAYSYKVDPRLCAAVSIVESSGGRYCIKPHNAWGWGAADSDPYNLASSWPSWEAAFEGWHRGMATSKTGLATTPSLTATGDIYCSTPIWGQKVATLMEQISGYVAVVEEDNAAERSSSGELSI